MKPNQKLNLFLQLDRTPKSKTLKERLQALPPQNPCQAHTTYKINIYPTSKPVPTTQFIMNLLSIEKIDLIREITTKYIEITYKSGFTHQIIDKKNHAKTS